MNRSLPSEETEMRSSWSFPLQRLGKSKVKFDSTTMGVGAVSPGEFMWAWTQNACKPAFSCLGCRLFSVAYSSSPVPDAGPSHSFALQLRLMEGLKLNVWTSGNQIYRRLIEVPIEHSIATPEIYRDATWKPLGQNFSCLTQYSERKQHLIVLHLHVFWILSSVGLV